MRYPSAFILAAVSLCSSAARAEEKPPAPTSEQQKELDALKQSLWDEGCSDEEIQAAIKNKREGGAGKGTQPEAKTPPSAREESTAPQFTNEEIDEIVDDLLLKELEDER